MKKIKKRADIVPEVEDPELDEVDEERGFEIEEDEETNEIVFVHHYRRRWGDNFDADIEHVLNVDEVQDLIGLLIQFIENCKKRAIISGQLVEKPTPTPVEGNPLQGPNNVMGK